MDPADLLPLLLVKEHNECPVGSQHAKGAMEHGVRFGAMRGLALA